MSSVLQLVTMSIEYPIDIMNINMDKKTQTNIHTNNKKICPICKSECPGNHLLNPPIEYKHPHPDQDEAKTPPITPTPPPPPKI